MSLQGLPATPAIQWVPPTAYDWVLTGPPPSTPSQPCGGWVERLTSLVRGRRGKSDPASQPWPLSRLIAGARQGDESCLDILSHNLRHPDPSVRRDVSRVVEQLIREGHRRCMKKILELDASGQVDVAQILGRPHVADRALSILGDFCLSRNNQIAMAAIRTMERIASSGDPLLAQRASLYLSILKDLMGSDRVLFPVIVSAVRSVRSSTNSVSSSSTR